MTPEELMRHAISLSLDNARSALGGPFGCLVVKDGEVVAAGANQVTAGNDPTAHAEIVAIREACRTLRTFRLTGCDLYTSCEPCPMCLGAIYWARLDRVFYANGRLDAAAIGFDDAFIYDEIPLAPELRKIPMHQLLRDEAQAAFRAWQQSPHKVEY